MGTANQFRTVLVLDDDLRTYFALDAIRRNGTALQIVPGIVQGLVKTLEQCRNLEILTGEAIVPDGCNRSLLDEESHQRILADLAQGRYHGIVLGHMNGNGYTVATAIADAAKDITVVRLNNRKPDVVRNYENLGFNKFATFVVPNAFVNHVKAVVSWPL